MENHEIVIEELENGCEEIYESWIQKAELFIRKFPENMRAIMLGHEIRRDYELQILDRCEAESVFHRFFMEGVYNTKWKKVGEYFITGAEALYYEEE